MKAVVTDETGIVLVEKTLKGKSNNIAELWALAEALLFARQCAVPDVEIYTDSRNNLAWVDGRIGKKLNDRQAVLTLHQFISTLRSKIPTTITWVPRDKNLAGLYLETGVEGSVPDDDGVPVAKA
jgi:ribonuclease HI